MGLPQITGGTYANNNESELENFNNERKFLEKDMLNKIEKKIVFDPNEPVTVLSGHNLHGGIIGIIASKLKDKFNKPTIIISISNGVGKASARSVYGFDIGTFIINAVQKNILISGGGHKMAAGFSIKEEKIEEFKDFIESDVRRMKNYESGGTVGDLDIFDQCKTFTDSNISAIKCQDTTINLFRTKPITMAPPIRT